MLVVVALGGNAILQRNQPLEESVQKENIAVAAKSIASIARDHQVVLTHGNGPQVGLLALQNEAYKAVKPYTLDVLGAESAGMLGYLIGQALQNEMPNHHIATLLTQTIIDKNDAAFQNPTKFVGPMYTQVEANQLAAAHAWSVKADGNGFRRVVPSPKPQAIVEIDLIRAQCSQPNTLLICAGGGGIPVIKQQNKLSGIEAVVDKDRVASLLAQQLHADCLLILSDVSCVESHFGHNDSKPIASASAAQLSQLKFADGSMGPKINAACEFVQASGKPAIIGHLTQAQACLQGKSGTQILSTNEFIQYHPM